MRPCIADPSLALIVAASPVSRIVLARITQRAYLKIRAVEPSEARHILSAENAQTCPGIVIVDIDAEMQISDGMFQNIEALRRASPRRLPRVIAIVPSRCNAPCDEPVIDAQVVRPVTPESLQPLIQRLLTGVEA